MLLQEPEHDADADTVELGDYVRLLPRERPFDDDERWWWRIETLDDVQFDAVYERRTLYARGFEVRERRRGVAFTSILAHRKPA